MLGILARGLASFSVFRFFSRRVKVAPPIYHRHRKCHRSGWKQSTKLFCVFLDLYFNALNISMVFGCSSITFPFSLPRNPLRTKRNVRLLIFLMTIHGFENCLGCVQREWGERDAYESGHANYIYLQLIWWAERKRERNVLPPLLLLLRFPWSLFKFYELSWRKTQIRSWQMD